MENYFLEKTARTPTIRADKSGEIRLEGICISENVHVDLGGLVAWIDAYAKSPADKTVVHVKLDYFNTSSASVLLSVFKTLANLKRIGKQVTVNWYHEEEDSEIKESGFDYASVVDVDFNVIPYTKEV